VPAQSVPRWRDYLRDLLAIVVPGLLLLLVLVVAHYRITLEQASQLMLAQEQATTELTRQLMRTRLNEMMADVKVLADTVSRQAAEPDRTQLTASFLQLARHKPGYSQLRFIDARGMEVVRVNNGPSPRAVAADQLQNKARRYYVAQSQNLPPGQVYISRFDLNMEQGQLQHGQPTLRVAAPVVGRQGERRGIVVLNLSGEQLVEQVWGQAPIGADAIVLVSGHGYSLVRPDAQQGRVQFFPDNPLAEHSPQLWRKLNGAEQGQFIQDDQLYAYASLVIPQAQGNARWKIFTLRDGSALGAVKSRFGWHNLPLYGLLALTLCVVALVNARHRRRHQQVMAHTAYERSFRLLLEQIQLAAVSLDRQGRVVFCNDHFVSLSGYARQDILGQDWVEAFVPLSRRRELNALFARAFDQGQVPDTRHGEVVTADGQQRVIAWTPTLQHNADGNIVQLSLVGEDISDRLAAEKSLYQLKQAVEQSANTVVMTDTRGLITYVNPAFCRLTGYSVEQMVGARPSILKSGHTSDEAYQQLWQALREGRTWQGEFHNRKKNGELFWERALISPVRDDLGQTLSYIAIKQDITEEKRLKTELEQATRERVRHEQLAAVGRMASMVAHDLRNPLSSVKVGLQMTSRKADLDDESREICQISLDQVRHMEGILEDLLAYSRPDALSLEWLNVNQLLEQVVMGQLRLIKDRNVFIDRDFDPRLPTLNADPVKLRQALQNLVVNAIDAAQGEGNQLARVSLQTRLIFTDHGLKVALTISNNGGSIDPCMCLKVFEPFFTTKAKGTGLGLAIVQRIVQQHRGRVTLEPAPLPQVGTRACVILPLDQLTDQTR